MGKAQSKRSVDITTEVAKDGKVEEGSGKMGKIEEVDSLKPQLNGTEHNENEISVSLKFQLNKLFSSVIIIIIIIIIFLLH